VGEPDSYESENKRLSECEITQLRSSSNEPNNTAVSVFLSCVSLRISKYSR
jgi:hypothetical protein